MLSPITLTQLCFWSNLQLPFHPIDIYYADPEHSEDAYDYAYTSLFTASIGDGYLDGQGLDDSLTAFEIIDGHYDKPTPRQLQHLVNAAALTAKELADA